MTNIYDTILTVLVHKYIYPVYIYIHLKII